MRLLDRLTVKPDGGHYVLDATPLFSITTRELPDPNAILIQDYIIYATISKSFSATPEHYEAAKAVAIQSVLHTLYDDVAHLTLEALEAAYAHDIPKVLDALSKLENLIGGKDVSL